MLSTDKSGLFTAGVTPVEHPVNVPTILLSDRERQDWLFDRLLLSPMSEMWVSDRDMMREYMVHTGDSMNPDTGVPLHWLSDWDVLKSQGHCVSYFTHHVGNDFASASE